MRYLVVSEEELLLDLWDLGWDMNYYNRRSHCQLMYTENKAYACSNLCLKILHVYGHGKGRTSVSGRLTTGTTLTHAYRSKLQRLQPVVSYRLGGESMWGLAIMSWYGGTNGWHTTSQNRINGDGWQILVNCRDPITNNGRGYKLEEKSFSCKLDNIFHVKITESNSTNHENTTLRLSLSITRKKIILNLLLNYKFWNWWMWG